MVRATPGALDDAAHRRRSSRGKSTAVAPRRAASKVVVRIIQVWAGWVRRGCPRAACRRDGYAALSPVGLTAMSTHPARASARAALALVASSLPIQAGRSRRGRYCAACPRVRLARVATARQGGTGLNPPRLWARAPQALVTQIPQDSARHQRNGHSHADSHRLARRPSSQLTHHFHRVRALGACAELRRAKRGRSSHAGGRSSQGRQRMCLRPAGRGTWGLLAGCQSPCRRDRRHAEFAAPVAYGV